MSGDGRRAALVVAAGKIGDPAAAATDTTSSRVGLLALGDEIESLPADFLLSLLAGAITAIQLLSRQMRFECNRVRHRPVLNHLIWLCNSVLLSGLFQGNGHMLLQCCVLLIQIASTFETLSMIQYI